LPSRNPAQIDEIAQELPEQGQGLTLSLAGRDSICDPARMAGKTDKNYTYDHEVRADGSVAFRCSSDRVQWPFLELPPHHPIVIHTINFWISVECSVARGTFDPEKWSALVWMDWECLDPDAGHAAHGVMENVNIDGKLGFAMKLFDDQDRPYCNIRGRGVVFRTRNFESWREEAKGEVSVNEAQVAFAYASPRDVGVEDCEYPLISSLKEGAIAHALITRDNGMPPASRYISGSGDHVNAVHIAEVARQFAALKLANPQVRLAGGEISFDHYIELGNQFSVTLTDQTDRTIGLKLNQAGRDCTKISLSIA
jgi:hypothetical protein